MNVILPKNRPKPRITDCTHARLRHDYATWHEEHREAALAESNRELPFEDKSKFDSIHIAIEAIGRSYGYPAVVAKNGNHVVVFDMGHQVGFCARSKRHTSTVTVVVKPDGVVVTAHPGTPWAKNKDESES